MNEHGFASVLGLCLLLLMACLSAAVIGIAQKERVAVDGFAAGLQAQSYAESGAEKALASLDPQILKEVKSAGKPVCIMSLPAEENAPLKSCQIYLAFDGDSYVLMAVSCVADRKGQVFVHFQPTKDGLKIGKWER